MAGKPSEKADGGDDQKSEFAAATVLWLSLLFDTF